ncbi:MAG: adenylate/guanylate cyclase domain-containing protein [Sneathiella sp.]
MSGSAGITSFTTAASETGPNPATNTIDNAIDDEIRIEQSVRTQGGMPVLLAGNAFAILIVFVVSPTLAFSSYAIYFEIFLLAMLLPMLRSYLRLRKLPRPQTVSRRRIRMVEIYSTFLGLVWSAIIILTMAAMPPIQGAMVLMTIYFLCFGGVTQMQSLPRAAIGYFIPLWLTATICAYLFDAIVLEVLVLMASAGLAAMLQTVWQNWRTVTSMVRLNMEKVEAEAEVHRRENSAMRAMLDAIPFPLVLTRNTGTLEASKTALRQFGITREQAISANIRDFFFDPEEQVRMAELQAEDGRLVEYELQFKDAEGKPFWALLSSLPLRYDEEDCWLNAIYIIDDRKRAEAETLEAKQRVEESNLMLETVSGQLSKYISPQLYSAIFKGEQDVVIASKRKKLTIFFSDIVNFTEITGQLESEELTALLNDYLSGMSVIAQRHGAYFDKFIGDAMMFYFGDPDTKGVKEDASSCVKMAIEMQRRLHQLQLGWQERGLLDRPFQARMGINTGYCTVGNFGSHDRMDHTIIGSEVNLAARLEAHADVGGILISSETFALVKDWLLAEEFQEITAKGFAKPIKTYNVIGIYDDLVSEGRVIHRNEAGLSLTIDREKMVNADKATVVQMLKDATAQLNRVLTEIQ